jgi:hypothetical protein
MSERADANKLAQQRFLARQSQSGKGVDPDLARNAMDALALHSPAPGNAAATPSTSPLPETPPLANEAGPANADAGGRTTASSEAPDSALPSSEQSISSQRPKRGPRSEQAKAKRRKKERDKYKALAQKGKAATAITCAPAKKPESEQQTPAQQPGSNDASQQDDNQTGQRSRYRQRAAHIAKIIQRSLDNADELGETDERKEQLTRIAVKTCFRRLGSLIKDDRLLRKQQKRTHQRKEQKRARREQRNAKRNSRIPAKQIDKNAKKTKKKKKKKRLFSNRVASEKQRRASRQAEYEAHGPNRKRGEKRTQAAEGVQQDRDHRQQDRREVVVEVFARPARPDQPPRVPPRVSQNKSWRAQRCIYINDREGCPYGRDCPYRH